MKIGHIEIIDNKLYFVYYKLEKPKQENYPHEFVKSIIKDFEKYEASKQLVRVVNGYSISHTLKHIHISFKNKSGKLIDLITNIPDNQQCKAEIINNKAIIIELIKQNMKMKYNKIEIKIPNEMDSERARKELGKAIYSVAVIFYETIGEHGKLTDGKELRGNGHHMAQNIQEKAQKLWDERLLKK